MKEQVKHTKEQQAIRKQDFLSNETFKMIAYAGAGKTYMLQRMGKDILNEDPRAKILYLAYNKSIAAEAKRKFPARVRCSTVHGMAYAAFGSKYHIYQLDSPAQPKKASVIPDKYKKTSMKWPVTNLMWETIQNYLYSGDDWIGYHHMPTSEENYDKEFTDDIIAIAKSVWERMQDPGDWFPITHDGYLKLYQLSRPDLGRSYDVIMIDEAQDCNGATLAIINGCTGCSKIFVGDPHQQIYGWRGSVNALDLVQGKEFRLSKSFRFGSNIANVATHILKELKHEKVPVKGVDIADSYHIRENLPKKKPITYIARTNAAIFAQAARSIKKGYTHSFVGGWDKKWGDLLLDMFNLWSFNLTEIKDGFIKHFPDIESLKIYAMRAKDYEILKTIKIVEKWKGGLPSILIDVKKESKIKNADVILTTGHKCKGLEWDNVYVCEDFATSLEKAKVSMDIEKTEDEYNLIYVACTRARKKLHINKKLADLLQIKG